MEMLKKLKDSVSNVLPVGNPVATEYEISSHRASAGPGLLWKVYDATRRSTRQPASVFICEKKGLERLSKTDRDRILDSLKRGVSQLTKLRHPNLLSVLHPLEESRDSIAFATEPVFASLANVLGRHDNLPVPTPEFLKQFELFDVEIKYGLFQLAEGLAFLHNSVKLVHSNICCDSVIINKAGAWKIAGFDFCIRNANDVTPYYPCPEWDLDCPPIAQPNLDYMAPEYILTNSCDTSSDMFSVGVLFYAVYNKGKTLFECRNELSMFRKNVADLKKMNLVSVLGEVPAEVRDYVKLLLNTEPSVRPDADQLSKLSFFEDMGSMTLQYMDSLFQRDNLQKSQFFKGLPKVIEKLPKRVNVFRVLPPLVKECFNKDMVPFILPCILLIADQCTNEEYVKHVLPGLKPIIGMKEPVQIFLILLQNMNLLLSKTPPGEIKLYILPMVYDAVEANNPQIQELCLSIMPTFASLIDYPAMKNSLIPRIKRVCLGTHLLNVRVSCLVCIGKLLEYMDKWYVLDEIIPILQAIPSREPGVLMSILGIYQVALTHKKLGITKDILATKVIPHIFPLVIDNNLNLQQFNAYMSVIREMMQRVETEQRTKLEQLNSIKNEQKSMPLGDTTAKPSSGVSNGAPGGTDTMMDKVMSGFGLLNYFGTSTQATTSTLSASGTSSASSSVSAVSPPAMNSIPTPKPADTKLPNQPAKVSLSLEEKQKLAQQQEMQQTFKRQAPLVSNPTPMGGAKTTGSGMGTGNSGPRDLTHTLFDSPADSLLSSSSAQTPMMSSVLDSDMGAFTSAGDEQSGANSQKSAYQSLGPIRASSNVNRGSPTFMNTNSSSSNAMGSSWSNTSTQNNQSTFGTQKSSSINTSAFDSLASSRTQAKTPMNSMPQANQGFGGMGTPMGIAGAPGMQMNQPRMMGNMQMGQQPMATRPQGMMGNMQMNQQPSMGNMSGSQNMMGNMMGQNRMGQPQGMNMGQTFGGNTMMGGGMQGQMLQPMRTQNNMPNNQSTAKSLSSKDIADFLG